MFVYVWAGGVLGAPAVFWSVGHVTACASRLRGCEGSLSLHAFSDAIAVWSRG